MQNPFSPKESVRGQHHKGSNVTAIENITINPFQNRGQPRFSSGSEDNDDENGNVSHRTPNRTIEERNITNAVGLNGIQTPPDNRHEELKIELYP